MGKLIVPTRDDPRPIVFISHQWAGYTAPDPKNIQFKTLLGAIEKLREDIFVYPNETFVGTYIFLFLTNYFLTYF